MSKRIQLEIEEFAISSEVGGYLLILKEKDGGRQLHVGLTRMEFENLLIVNSGIEPEIPLSHSLFSGILNGFDIKVYGGCISKIEKGKYYANLYLQQNNLYMKARTSLYEALMMCLMQKSPFFILESLIDKRIARDHTFLKQPIEVLKIKISYIDDIPQLMSLMDCAVSEEKYEVAELLKEQINKLKNNS